MHYVYKENKIETNSCREEIRKSKRERKENETVYFVKAEKTI